MNASPLSTLPLFSVGSVRISAPVLAPWSIMAGLVALGLGRRQPLIVPSPSRLHCVHVL
ncbi:F0F1 ATP synthase subunit A, partial [Burkholderia thailandensis]|nr:F0F1 ATP synthase subunit A [Burkholderia thailandensis]